MRALICSILLLAAPAAGVGQTTQLPDNAQAQTQVRQLQARLRDVNRLILHLRSRRDALGDLGQADMLMLQQLTQQKMQLEQMISNTMKAQGETGGTIRPNLKAS